MHRKTQGCAGSIRVVGLLLGLAAAGAGALGAGEGRPAPASGWLPEPAAAVLRLLGLRPGLGSTLTRPAPAPARVAQAGAPGRRHPRRFVPSCGSEIAPNGGCL